MNDNPNWKPPGHNSDEAATIDWLAGLADRLLVLLEKRDANCIAGDAHARFVEESRVHYSAEHSRYMMLALDRLGAMVTKYFEVSGASTANSDTLDHLSDSELSDKLNEAAMEHRRILNEVGKRLDTIQGGFNAPE